uniref:Uncharacterized protein n=1 Tax=Utricularia reniformis TaxID=192314 RepID=A0A1Y0B3S0_9LAMI|nr:hypothetical protein AEK19_MT0847 [Utricularia reniformis]YP_009382290.1 hypothetical protein AEK19_MT1862 [Utricularia reniformis]ART31078.1 hypothetical protein AEK19_MT0847 [Utricularia reniformis]ART32033.1 hypothetical protein AEK19_MT1862 [Utricularia reniformis]
MSVEFKSPFLIFIDRHRKSLPSPSVLQSFFLGSRMTNPRFPAKRMA